MATTIIPFINDYALEVIENELVPEFVGIEENPSQGVLHIPVVYGFRKVEGVRLWTYVPESNGQLLYCVYALSEDFCRGVGRVFIDDVAIEIDYSTLTHRQPISVGTGPYGGILEMEFVDGRWANSAYGSGAALNVGGSALIQRDLQINKNYPKLCYLVCRFFYQEPTPYRNIPKVSVDLFGRRVPPFTTGVLSANYTTNPVDILWDLLNNQVYGAGLAPAKINATSFTSVKAACDTLLSGRGGSAIKQFEANWICDTSNTLMSNIKELLDSFQMTLTLVQGQYVLAIESNPTDSDQPSGLMTFNENNILSNIQIQYPNLGTKLNKVFVEYPDKDNNFQMRTEQFPSESVTTFRTEDNNQILDQKFTANLITDYWHANDLAQMILRKSRGQLVYRFTADKTAHRLRVGDRITLNTALPLISNQQVVVVSMEMRDDYTFDLECVTYSTTFYPLGFSGAPLSPSPGDQQPPGGGGPTPTPTPTPTPNPPSDPAYAITTNGDVFNEGTTVNFTVSTTGVTDGTLVNWFLEATTGSIASTEITPNALSGQLTINSNAATYSFAIANDAMTEGDETWVWSLRSPTNGSQLASKIITVRDTSVFAPPPKYAYTFAGASTLDIANTSNQRVSNPDWYMAFTNSIGAYDATETDSLGTVTWAGGPPTVVGAYANDCVRQRISRTLVSGSQFYSTVDIDICLIDRLTANQATQRNIFCVYDNFDTYLAGTGQGYLNQYYKSHLKQLMSFNFANPPTGSNALRATLRTENDVVRNTIYERIDNTSTSTPLATNLPGCVRLRPVSGKAGHYATNVGSTSSSNTIKTIINVGSNQNPTFYATGSNIHNCYLAPFDLTSTHTSTNRRLRLHFFEVIPVSNAINFIGFKVVGVGLNRNSITAKYYDQSRLNLTSTIGSTTNPMP